MLQELTSHKRYTASDYRFMQRVCLSHTLAQYARWLVENKYTTEADGLPGNDDYGTEENIDFVH